MSKHNSGEFYAKLAEKNGLRVVNGSNHYVAYGKAGRGYETIPRHKTLSPGVEHKIRGWFKALGIIVPALLVIFMFHLPYIH